jgi:hypothetical protein
VLLVVTLIGLPSGADDGFTLNLERLPIAGAEGPGAAAPRAADRTSLDTENFVRRDPSHGLVYHSAATPRTRQEYRLALWNSPMGRLHYERAAAAAMLGREGLVGGGRLAGLGLATAALGDGDPSGLQVLLTAEHWHALSPTDMARAGLQASIAAALLYLMTDNAN